MKETLKYWGVGVLSIGAISCALQIWFPIWVTASFIIGLIGAVYITYTTFFETMGLDKLSVEEVTGILKDRDIIIDSYEEQFKEHEVIMSSQKEVIVEYEKMFDSMAVELPCVCGGNTFEGLFSPNTDNEVECEKCHNKYRVNIQYDTILISEPLDINNKSVGDIIGQ